MRRIAPSAILFTLVAATAAVAPGVSSGVVAASPAGPPLSAMARGAVTGPARPATYTPPPVHWGRCTDAGLRRAKARCGTLVVPLDYAHPAGEKIDLAVSRVRHRAGTRYQGVMLTNPGGPGAPGLTLSTLGALVPHHAGDGYDWIGLDPRGVGASRPALSCIPRYFHVNRPYYVPRTPALLRTWKARAKRYAEACATSPVRQLLDHLRTVDTVQDMESLRIALGRQRLNLYGFSYGTYLGQVYATRFPDRVGRFVLDSNVDPRSVWYPANVDQDIAFEGAIRVFFRWVAQHDRTYHLGKRGVAIERGFFRLRERLYRHPARGGLGPDELTDGMLAAGYYAPAWPQVAKAYAQLVNQGRTVGMLRAYRILQSPRDDNGYANYLATECTDASWPSLSRQLSDAARVNRGHPFYTWGNTWFNAPCVFWPVAPKTPPTVDGRAVRGPVLLIDETRDAATPYPGSLEVRRRFPTASLVAGVGGTSHAVSLSGVACVDNTIAAYLRRGVVPQRKPGGGADKLCPPLRPPKP